VEAEASSLQQVCLLGVLNPLGRFHIQPGKPLLIAVRLRDNQREKLVLMPEHPCRTLFGLCIELLDPVQGITVIHLQG
jgi:hypothetical protein